MKTLYVVSENRVINGYTKLVEVNRFLDEELAKLYIQRNQNLREEKVRRFEYMFPETVGQMSIAEFPVCETLKEAESEV